MSQVIAPIQNTNNIRYADFVRIVTPSTEYRFSTAPTAITVPAVDALPFDGLGQLIGIGKIQRDIKSTANQTTITLVGIDTALLGVVLNGNLKGAQITMWKGFFNTDGTLIHQAVLAVFISIFMVLLILSTLVNNGWKKCVCM